MRPTEAPPACKCVHYEANEFEKRSYAVERAAAVLRVKAGKYADRPLDVYDVVHLAEWLLGEPVLTEEARDAIREQVLKVVEP